MSAAPYRYAECEPAPALAPWVLSYWSFSVDEVPASGEPFTVWPDGCVSIAIIAAPIPGPRVLLTGPRVTALRPPLRPHSTLLGFRLWPDASFGVMGQPPRSLRDAAGPAPAPIAAAFGDVVRALDGLTQLDEAKPALDAALAARMSAWAPPDAQVRRAVRYIVAQRGEVEMPAVAREADLGLRQLQRRFLASTALTLREWARVRRLRESLAIKMAGASGWSAVAAATGFADHAHLTREFVALTGLAPSVAAKHLDTIAHGNVRP